MKTLGEEASKLTKAEQHLNEAVTAMRNKETNDTDVVLHLARSVLSAGTALEEAKASYDAARQAAAFAAQAETIGALRDFIETRLSTAPEFQRAVAAGIAGFTVNFSTAGGVTVEIESGARSGHPSTATVRPASTLARRSTAPTTRSRSPNCDVIFRRFGQVGPGTPIGVVLHKLPSGASADDRRFTAKIAANGRDVIWDHDGQIYAISRLARRLSEFGVHANGDSENGYRVFGRAAERMTSLEEYRKQLESGS